MKIPSLKQLTINLIGRRLTGRSYAGTGNSFFSELSTRGSDAGILINNETALNYTAFWACVRLLTRTMASLPFIVYERQEPRGKNRATNHPLYRLLHDEPNPEMDAYNYIESMVYHLIANNGNAYSYIDFEDDNVTIKHLWLMNPDRTSKKRDEATREIYYEYQTEKDGLVKLPAYRVWHIPGFGFDGLIGYTPLTFARNQIGLGIAAERMGAKIFSNGLTFGGFLQHPGRMTPEAHANFKAQLKRDHQGVDKAHRLLILEEGMTYSKNTIPPNDAQWLETRKFQRNEMAAWFGIPPHKIGDLDRATNNNIEHQNLEFVTDAIRPLAIRIEKSANRQLIQPLEKGRLFTEFLMDALLRGDSAARAQFYRELYYLGALSPNDIREKENMNPIDDPHGDEYFVQQNVIAMSMLDRQGQLPPAGNQNNNQNQ
jgi:HK97 family phage portal protein